MYTTAIKTHPTKVLPRKYGPQHGTSVRLQQYRFKVSFLPSFLPSFVREKRESSSSAGRLEWRVLILVAFRCAGVLPVVVPKTVDPYSPEFPVVHRSLLGIIFGECFLDMVSPFMVVAIRDAEQDLSPRRQPAACVLMPVPVVYSLSERGKRGIHFVAVIVSISLSLDSVEEYSV
jgi:hypothetical protein